MSANAPLLRGLACAAAMLGCAGEAPEGVVDDCVGKAALPPSVSTDILFVIDNSQSMENEQAKVVAELNTFVSTLASAPVKNDFQIAVITTAVTARYRDCDPASMPTFVTFDDQSGRLQLGKDLDGDPVPASTRKILRFDDPDLLDQFAVLIGQGIQGPGQEMGLEAARLALSEPLISRPLGDDPPGNFGLLRPGAQLLVVVVSDEDDCSDPGGTALVLEPTCGDSCKVDSDCGGPGEYCVPDDLSDPTGPRRCQRNACETPTGRSKLEPVDTYVDFFKNLDDGTGRRRDVYLAVIGAVDADGDPGRCRQGNEEAQGVAERYRDAVDAMGDRGFIDSICRDSYAATLERIAALVNAPQTIELAGDPPDGDLVQVRVRREGEKTIVCRNGDGFSFEPAAGGAPARVTMEGRCRLRHGDELEVRFVCAG